MTIDIEEHLVAGMRQEVADVALTSDVVDAAARRHHRRTMLGRAAYSVGAVSLASVTALVLTVGAGGQPGSVPNQPSVASPATPRMELAAAVTASENISYRIRVTTEPGGLTYEGAFDPKTATGYLRQPQDDSVMTELLINGTRYIGGERPLGKLPADKGPGETYGRYGQYPGKHGRLSLHDAPDTVLGAATPDPATLFKALKSANATITENADGTLHFEYDTRVKDGSIATRGDVTLDGNGRIAKVVITDAWQTTAKGRLDTGTSTATLELFEYGVEVKVERPTDVVPAR